MPGVELVQDVVWSDNKSDVPSKLVRTDAQGRFHFPTLEHRAGVARMVSHQTVILQAITIRHERFDYTAWQHAKDSSAVNSELDGKPLKLERELTREADFEGKHYGICRVV